MHYEFWVLHDGAPSVRLEVPMSTTPEVRWTGGAQIKRTLSLSCLPPENVNWLTDKVAVIRVGSGGNTTVGLGVFCVPTHPSKTDDDGMTLMELTGYDECYALAQLAKVESTLTLRAGRKYVDCIREQLFAGGIDQIRVTDSTEVLPVDKAYEAGTSRYTILAELLGDINYRDLWFDGNGTAICEPWVAASVSTATHDYSAGEDSILMTAMDVDDDTFNAANVFVDLVSSADLSGDLRSESVNDNIGSPLSVQRRGMRVVSVETLDTIASQTALDTHAKNRMLQSMMSSETYTFYTDAAADGEHGLNDSLLLQRDGIGLLEEQDWAIACVPGGRMTHTGKKVYYNYD